MSRSKSATARLAAEQAAQENTARRIAEAHAQRNAALDNDEDTRAAELLAEIRQLELLATGHNDKIQRLQAAVEREASEEQARRHAAHIKRVEKKLAEFRENGSELALAIAAAEAKFRKMVDIVGEVQTMWNFQPHDLAACFLTPGRIVEALQYEIYRIGARPMLLGGQREMPQAGLNFPGGKSPRIELMGQPDRIEPLTSMLEKGIKIASEILHTGHRSIAAAIELPAAAPAIIAPEPPAAVTNGNAEPQRSPAEARLGALLAEMAKAGEDISPEGERRYQEIQEQVAEAHDQVNREKGIIQ